MSLRDKVTRSFAAAHEGYTKPRAALLEALVPLREALIRGGLGDLVRFYPPDGSPDRDYPLEEAVTSSDGEKWTTGIAVGSDPTFSQRVLAKIEATVKTGRDRPGYGVTFWVVGHQDKAKFVFSPNLPKQEYDDYCVILTNLISEKVSRMALDPSAPAEIEASSGRRRVVVV